MTSNYISSYHKRDKSWNENQKNLTDIKKQKQMNLREGQETKKTN